MRLLRHVSVLFISSLCTAAFAETSTSSPTVDQMHQPGGLFDATPHTRASQIAVWGDLDWGGIGIGGRYNMPLVADGFLPELNDSFELEFGPDIYFSTWGLCGLYVCSGLRLDLLAEGRWTFHLWPNLAAYAKLSVGPSIWLGSYSNVAFHFNIGPGIIYQLNDKMDVRAEVGYSGFHVGLGWAL